MKNCEPFETQMFDWKDWDQLDTFAFAFYNVTLTIKIGEYDIGTHFDFADVDYENSLVNFYLNEKGDDPVLQMTMKVQLVPFVKEKEE